MPQGPTLYELLRKEFEQEIAKKTGWGKNEVMIAFDKAATLAMAKLAAARGIDISY